MALLKRFKDFLLRNSIQNQDYVVGYDSKTGEEIRIKASVLQGAAGSSAEIQFSADQASWHYPIADNDLYIRIRIGNGAWNVAKFVAEQAEVGSLTFSSAGQNLPENAESFSEEITLHKVAKTGSYSDLPDRPTNIEEFDGNFRPEYFEEDASAENLLVEGEDGWFGKMSVRELLCKDMNNYYQDFNSGDNIDYVVVGRSSETLIKISIQEFKDYLNSI